ncbi:uncharacterized protein LOC126592476 isoform X1 [Malus sylvestris]|uniref:uncharacterized protein LOC126592476 isoform X1 n=1 Tax=Malus sylvestris TaxID=3752 RepID=UPI0021ACCAB2|nr:uncharacterized protein LOC126592476 isoform X1 [Malus sylvestris]
MEKLENSTIFTSCLFLFLLATPCFSKVGESDLMDTEVYEIDYRGPETHSSVPPPGHSHGKKSLPLIHKENAMATPKPNSIEGANMGRKVKKVHG